jgi:FkbM family methyltransferase
MNQSLKLRLKRLLPDRLWLLGRQLLGRPFHWRQTYSQIGQDYWVIHEVFLQKRQGYFVEIGSADGIFINNTYLLEKHYDWSGLCIEPNPTSFAQLQKNRRSTCLNLCLDAEPGEVDFVFDGMTGGIRDRDTDLSQATGPVHRLQTQRLVDVLDAQGAPAVIDYLSIDVEGAEERILRNFPFERYTFLSITIERPSDWLHGMLSDRGYLLIKRIPGIDSFYLHESLSETYAQNLMDHYHQTSLY